MQMQIHIQIHKYKYMNKKHIPAHACLSCVISEQHPPSDSHHQRRTVSLHYSAFARSHQQCFFVIYPLALFSTIFLHWIILPLGLIHIYPYSVAPMIQFHLVDRLIDLGDKVSVKSEDICQMCQNQGGKL